MDFGLALKTLLDKEGIKILNHQMIVNHLMDLQAFERMPQSRYLTKMLYYEGCFQHIYSLLASGENIQSYWDVLHKDMKQRWGFREDVADYIAMGIAFALDIETKPSIHRELVTEKSVLTKHFAFKNVEIDGSIQSVVDKLSQQGFLKVSQEPFSAFLQGDFAGIKDCSILVKSSEYTNVVFTICVFLPECDNWWGLRVDYDDFKAKLTRKYGEPTSVEEFDDPYYEGDGYEKTAIENGKARYYSSFNLTNGIIRLSITSRYVLINYIDRENKRLMEQAKDLIADEDL